MSIATESLSQAEGLPMNAPADPYRELVVLTARAVCQLDGVDNDLKRQLGSELAAVQIIDRYTADVTAPMPTAKMAIREAAHTSPGMNHSPFDAIISNSIEQLAQEYPDLLGDDLESVALIRSAIERGIEIANTRLGDLA